MKKKQEKPKLMKPRKFILLDPRTGHVPQQKPEESREKEEKNHKD